VKAPEWTIGTWHVATVCGGGSYVAKTASAALSYRLRSKMSALENVTHTVGKATRQQYILRTKSLLGYAHKVGYTPFMTG
jgi:hypothetical protein